MRNITELATIVVMLLNLGCEPDQVGNLNTQHAMYAPDSAVFKATLDPDDPEDARKIEFQIPWQSGGLQGIEGTNPKDYRILHINCSKENEEAAKQFYMTAVNGVIELPCNHTVPAGRYVFTIEISNENGKNVSVLDAALKIIIE